MKKLLVISHCVLNQDSVVDGLQRENVYQPVLPYLEDGVGLIQLPCPEVMMYGLKRWYHVKEQFDTPHFRNKSRELLLPIVDQLEHYLSEGFEVKGIAGVAGSPSCGCNKTCSGTSWKGDVQVEIEDADMVDGSGIFMEVFKEILKEREIELPFFDII